jgi:lipoate-protein ligase A
MTVWRFIPPVQAAGVAQMALDTWLFEQHIQGLCPPILRFYTWEPVAISLGYHQRQYPAHWQDLVWQGRSLDIVQRPTGGRAVLHQGDLTYAVITSGLTGDRKASYRQLCEFLIQGWRSLGVDLNYGTSGRGDIHQPNCFGTATAADLVLPNGAKLIGSAQLRRGSAVLQHGSIRLNPDAALFSQVFEADAMLPTLAIALKETKIDSVIAALTNSAKTCFNADFQVSPISDGEWQQALHCSPASTADCANAAI